MLQPVPMAKVAIVGAKPRLPETIETLHRLNLLHIEDFTGGDDKTFDLGSPLPGGSQVSQRLLRVRGVLKGAQMTQPKDSRPFSLDNLRALEGRLKEIEEEVSRLVEERSKVQDEAKALLEQSAVLARIANLTIPTRALSGYRSVASAAGFVPSEADLELLRTVHPDADWLESHEADGRFIAVFVPKAAERALQDALGKLAFQPLEVPAYDAPPAAQRAALDARRADLESRLAQLEEKISNIREKHAAAFFALDEYLAIEADKATAPVRFRTTPNSFMIEGWIPHDAYARLEASLAKATKNGVFLTRLQRAATSHRPTTHHGSEGEHGEANGVSHPEPEDVPVQLKNFNRAGPYELLTDTYSRPKYSELDPTLFLYIGFPFFFGMMLGDVGYGIVLLLLVVGGVFNKVYQVFGFQSRWHLNRIFLHCAVSSILFGLLFAEFFGLELWGRHGILGHAETHFGPIPWPLARLEYVKLLLALSLLVGVVHLFIGLLLGIRNAAAEHGMKEAIKHRGSWLCILLAVTLAGIAIVPDTLQLNESPAHEGDAAAAEAAPAHEEKIIAHPAPFYYASMVLLAVGIVLLVMGEGGIALLELPTVLSNLLSYTRLVAIGLSGVGIALAGNKVAAGMIAGTIPGGLVAGIITAVLFHLMGVALGILGPALHALRLHYVEFFTKFYTGGGTPYAPFGAQRKYTIQEVKQA